jgi:hypothetical protein
MRDTGEKGERPSFFAWPGTWVGGGLTLVAAGVGIGTGLAAKQNYNNANDVADQIKSAAARDGLSTRGICNTPPSNYANACQAWQDDKDKADRFKTFSIVGFVAAGVFAAGTVLLYFATTGGEASASASARPHRISAQLVPVVSPTVRGLALTGNF